jgi:hypothetical protein
LKGRGFKATPKAMVEITGLAAGVRTAERK